MDDEPIRLREARACVDSVDSIGQVTKTPMRSSTVVPAIEALWVSGLSSAAFPHEVGRERELRALREAKAHALLDSRLSNRGQRT